MITTVRILKRAEWPAEGGRAVQAFEPGEVVSARDPRVAGGFLETAVRSGWAEALATVKDAPTNAALDTPARSPEPERRTAAHTAPPKRTKPEPPDEDEPAKPAARRTAAKTTGGAKRKSRTKGSRSA